jgi:DNA repair protein RadC
LTFPIFSEGSFVFKDIFQNPPFMNDFSLAQLAPSDRPREKLIENGVAVLSDSDLLAIIIRNGFKGLPATNLAKTILLSVDNDLTRLSRMNLHELSSFKGMGKVKAVTVMAALELGRRRRFAEGGKALQISSSKDAASVFIPLLSDLCHEEFWMLLMNRANRVICRYQVSKGGISGTVVDPKMVYRKAVEQSASSLIFCHNHPSGNLSPSEADLQLTKKLVEAGRLFDMQVLDHVIIAGDNYYSFADEGRI